MFRFEDHLENFFREEEQIETAEDDGRFGHVVRLHGVETKRLHRKSRFTSERSETCIKTVISYLMGASDSRAASQTACRVIIVDTAHLSVTPGCLQLCNQASNQPQSPQNPLICNLNNYNEKKNSLCWLRPF